MLKYVCLMLAVLMALLAPSAAFAYVGPGAGLSAVGSLLSLLAAIGLAIVGFVWYPIRRLLRRIRPQQPNPDPGE
jgi:hypothetical protein